MIVKKARERGKIAGIHNGTTKDAKEMLNLGYQFVTVSSDFRSMSSHAQNIVDDMKNIDNKKNRAINFTDNNKISIENINSFTTIFVSLSIIIIPIILVLSQPDLGTSILIALSGLIVLWLGGVKMKYFFISLIGFLISLPFIISFLKPYQKMRILTFLDPDRDPLGAGYQIIQSKIAIGSGGITGKGFLKGTQSYLEFLPEKHTDFIFTLFSEEFGFVGSICLLLIYSIIIIRIIRIGAISRSNFAKLFCFGFAFAIFVYIVVNLSMVLGLLPIVGSPLPILSFGGSSLLATMIGFGIVLSAKINHKQMIA